MVGRGGYSKNLGILGNMRFLASLDRVGGLEI
jgi:hypothetical protein